MEECRRIHAHHETKTITHSIGAACAHSLLSKGATLALTYSTNEHSLRELISELETVSNGRKISAHQANMAVDADIHRLFEEIQQIHGQSPDILIANAGHGKAIPNILDIDIDEFDYTLRVNLRSAFLLSKLAIPHMQAQEWGRIVYISSIAAGGTSLNGCHYAASKAGLQGLSKNLALKLAKQGITCNDVAPAMITGTGMIPDEDRLRGTVGDPKNIPVGRAGTTQECANAVTMLVETGYMTGQSLLISGGLK